MNKEEISQTLLRLDKANMVAAQTALTEISTIVTDIRGLADKDPQKLPPTADSSLIADFAEEAKAHLVAADMALLELIEIQDDSPSFHRLVRVFHAIHTRAGFLHLTQIAALASAAKNLLVAISARKAPLNSNLLQLLNSTIDSITGMVAVLNESLCANQSAPPQFGVDDLLTRLRWALTDSTGNSPPD